MNIHAAWAETRIELDTTTIRGNKELPRILYIIPWKELKQTKSNKDQQLVLHSLFGDLFDPIAPNYTDLKDKPEIKQN